MFAENLRKRVEEVTKNTAKKFITLVPDNISQERMNICVSCEHYWKLTSQCKKCGCFLIGKTKLPFSECPIKKWDRYIDNSN